jgi:hypothetical protein
MIYGSINPPVFARIPRTAARIAGESQLELRIASLEGNP